MNAEMKSVITDLAGAKANQERASLQEIDWAADIKPFSAWLEASWKFMPLDDQVAGLWFCVPDVLINDASTYVVGFGSFDERPRHAGWATGVLWKQDPYGRRGKRVPRNHPAECTLPALRECQRACRVGPGAGDVDGPSTAVENLVLGCSLAHMFMLLRHALPRVSKKRSLGGRPWRGVGFGFPEGDTHCVGVIGPDGWLTPGSKYRASQDKPPASARMRNGRPVIDIPDEFNVAAYLKSGGDPRATDEDGQTILMASLHNVFRRPNYKVARELLVAGHDVNARTSYNTTAMFDFIDAPLDLLKYALERGGDPNVANKGGHTPMHFAARHQRARSILPMLVKAGGDVNRAGMQGQRPLHAAVANTDASTPAAVRTLVELGADVNMKDGLGRTPLIVVVQSLTEQIKHSSDPDQREAVAAARALLDHGADADCRMPRTCPGPFPAGGTPLMSPFYGDGSLHVALLKHGANPLLKCPKGKTAIHYAKAALKSPGKRKKPGMQRALDAMRAAAEKPANTRG